MNHGRLVGVIATAFVVGFCGALTAKAAVAPYHQLAQHDGGWMAKDANRKHAWMYVASGLTDPILIYDLTSPLGPRKIGEITDGLKKPGEIAIDAKGTLYAPNYNEGKPGGTVTIYPAHATRPSLTLSEGLSVPLDVAVDASGKVYVVNRGSSPGIVVFPPGQTTPAETITSSLIQSPNQIVFDSGQNLFFSDDITGVSESPYGSQQPVSLNLQGLKRPEGLALDPHSGNLLVSDIDLNEIFVFAPNDPNATRAVPIDFSSCFLTSGIIERGEYIFVPDCRTSGTVLLFKHNVRKPVATWSFNTEIGSCCLAFKPAGVL